jgi:hypothetical protein
MNKIKLILNYLFSQALPFELRKQWKRNDSPPKITILTLFLILVNIYYPIKQFFKEIKFFLWLRNLNIDYLFKNLNYEHNKLFHLSYKS